MERMRTLAFQVPDSLFQRVKAYLERNHMSQKQFVIGLIEAELEQDEALYQSEQTEEKVEESDENEQTDQAESGPQEAQEGPGAELEEQPAPTRTPPPWTILRPVPKMGKPSRRRRKKPKSRAKKKSSKIPALRKP